MKFSILSLTLAAASTAVYGQEVVSARAGMVHYVEGSVTLDGQAIDQVSSEKMFTQAHEVKNGQELATTLGRAEILLSPGVVLRLGEDSAIRMISSKIEDTRVELLRGQAVLSVEDLLKENRVTLKCANALIVPERTGVYRVNAGDTPELLVFDGKAQVIIGDERVASMKRGRVISLAKAESSRKFDTDETSDALLRWSQRRATYLAMANVSAAKSMLDSGTYRSAAGWRWNPYFGMFTYIPARGVICNGFWGYCFYTPGSVYTAIYRPVMAAPRSSGYGGGPQYGYNSNNGYVTSSQRSYGGYSPTGTAAAAAPAAPAAPARSAESAVGRGGSGGGRSR